jgi:hypothetical protein
MDYRGLPLRTLRLDNIENLNSSNKPACFSYIFVSSINITHKQLLLSQASIGKIWAGKENTTFHHTAFKAGLLIRAGFPFDK